MTAAELPHLLDPAQFRGVAEWSVVEEPAEILGELVGLLISIFRIGAMHFRAMLSRLQGRSLRRNLRLGCTRLRSTAIDSIWSGTAE